MKSDKLILEEASTRFNQFLDSTIYWRDYELAESYQVESGADQWTSDDYARQLKDDMPIITINKTAPVVDAIAGFEVQNRTIAKYYPRLPNDQQEGFADVVGNTAAYINQDTDAPTEISQAFRDMLICGIGPVNTTIDDSENPDGEVNKRRFFPGFLLYDPAARRKNMKDAEWLAEAKPTYWKQVDEEYDLGEGGAKVTFSRDNEFLNFFDSTKNRTNLCVVYEYQWREKETICRLKNPFGDYAEDQLAMNFMAEAVKSFGLNVQDAIFSLKQADWKALQKGLDALGIEYEKPLRQKKYCYYRAIIAGGTVVEKSENYSQRGFSIKVMTGKFDEIKQCYYGVLRAIKPAQRLLNQSVSDYQGYLDTVPKGGVNIEEDAVSDIGAFIDTYAKARKVTVFKSNALSGGKVIPKVAPAVPAGLPEMITRANGWCMEVIGVTLDFMGITESRDMGSALYAQKVRQGLTVLAPYFDAKKSFIVDDGELTIDCVRVLAENAPGRLIRNVTGEGSEKYFSLLKDGIAAEYDVIVEEAPQMPNERQETFQQLMEMSASLLNKPNPVDITPLAIEFAPLPKEKLDSLRKMMVPPPPPPPDPGPSRLIMSEAILNEASAEQKKADAKKTEVETLELFQKINSGGGEAAVIQTDPLEVARLELEKEKLVLKHRELDLDALNIRLQNKQLASNERIKMAESEKTPEAAALEELDQQDAAEMQLETDNNQRQAELDAREAAMQAQISQLNQVVENIRNQDNAILIDTTSKIAEAISAVAKGQAQQVKAQTQVASALVALTTEIKKDDEPKEVKIKVIRNKAGEITGAVKH